MKPSRDWYRSRLIGEDHADHRSDIYDYERGDAVFDEPIGFGEKVIRGLEKALKCTLTPRQVEALWNLRETARWMRDEVMIKDALAIMRAELIAFLTEAGCQPPSYRPGREASPFTRDVHCALGHYNRWMRSAESGNAHKASIEAFSVAVFIEGYAQRAFVQVLEGKHARTTKGRKKGIKKNADKVEELRTLWVRLAKNIRKRHPDWYKRQIVHAVYVQLRDDETQLPSSFDVMYRYVKDHIAPRKTKRASAS